MAAKVNVVCLLFITGSDSTKLCRPNPTVLLRRTSKKVTNCDHIQFGQYCEFIECQHTEFAQWHA
tara:strand:- start:165 stop:359 length:195 start_codon:yes stop_codon:yes gene_type:complete